MPTDLLTEEDLQGLEGMCRRRQGRRQSVTLDLDVALALVRDARALRRVERLADEIHQAAERAAASDAFAEDVGNYLIAERLIREAITEPASERGEGSNG